MRWLRLSAALLAICAGGYAGYAALRANVDSGSLTVAENGVWRTNPLIGSRAADAHTRAGIAVMGLLALPRGEAVYYNAETDGRGRPLKAGAVYEIRGGGIPARWWSLTAYGEDHYLIPNETQAYSIKSTQVRREADGGFVAYLAPEPRGDNWIASGEEPQRLSLTLRLYGPPNDLEARLAEASLPDIRRIGEARP